MLSKLRNFLIVSVLAISITGCGAAQGTPLGTPVNVSGKIAADGKPVGNVNLNLQPLESGYEKTIPVKADGTFSVETHPGKYAYYFTPKAGTKTVPPAVTNCVKASIDRTVQVASDKALDIEVK